MQLDQFPRFPLAHLPTPLEPLTRLQAALGGPRLYIKRDDCTGLATGGNKTRKLEFLIGDALAQKATTVISEGGIQSNHVRQTAAAAAKAGLKCHLVLERNVPIDRPVYTAGGNLLLDRLLGATIHYCDPGETRATRSVKVMEEVRRAGEAPYYIPTGGSNAIGARGYAASMVELEQQAGSQGLRIDHIVVASGSGGTQAGLILGKAVTQSKATIIGIDVDHDPEPLMAAVRKIVQEGAAELGLGKIADEDFQLIPGYAAPGYGMPNAGMIEAVELLARLEGILLDPVYAGKAMAGLIDMVRRGRFGSEETVAFIHTGGTPALFAYADIFA
ncbi:D-cysteine desulfhydrase [Dongia soli]|uniref:D-cysteine desulfhydrase n=1 Tax=Dongia soli TaxID=600628 RepID=A0ABU5E5N6_9PROT|nr:D-cysteine desulfhydrase [Dongia soli]MDY0881359.1 D-cysteine desulfhydrase [Dongia soli]